MFHVRLRDGSLETVLTLFKYLDAPPDLIFRLEKLAIKPRLSSEEKQHWDELHDFVYRETSSKANLKHAVKIYSRFSNKSIRGFLANPFVQFLVGAFNEHFFEEYLSELPSAEMREYFSKRINDFHKKI